MINRSALLSDLQKLVKQLEADLAERSDAAEVPEVKAALRAEYEKAQTAKRTAQSYEAWRGGYATQVAVAWVLGAVFARFLEDNGLVEQARISGPGERLQRARDEHELYFRAHPLESDRAYLLAVFRELGALPGMGAIFVEQSPVFELPTWLSGDGAKEILSFFQRIDGETGALVHDFADENWDTRFLGDLYQDLSKEARTRYALLQTPIFVGDFILDRTLEPGINEFGLDGFRMIDPACGSGHLLLGAFERIFDRWQKQDLGKNTRVLTQLTLDSIHGVDINPYALAIARFRLLIVAMRSSEVKKVRNAPAFRFNLACGDSLLHGEGSQLSLGDWTPTGHHFRTENVESLNQILKANYYHAVVGNPPYIVIKDKALNSAYRNLYPSSCFGRYSLAVPFIERAFQLSKEKGFVGHITTNSFMKRGFGKKIIADFFPKIDLTHVIDTSKAYIPGHGTPTAILFGRKRPQVKSSIRTVMGLKGEFVTPEHPELGLVWTAITELINQSGKENEFVCVQDLPIETFRKHPWTLGGGEAKRLKDYLDSRALDLLGERIDEIGMFGVTGSDAVMMAAHTAFQRKNLESDTIKKIIVGEKVRDWVIDEGDSVILPYKEESLVDISEIPLIHGWLWPYKTTLGNRTASSGKSYFRENIPWWSWRHASFKRIRTPDSIVCPEVSTHNSFAYIHDKQAVFKQSAPILKLPATSDQDSHFSLLGILNCSCSCFWLKQVFHDKGGGGIGGGLASEGWEHFFQYNGEKLKQFPIPKKSPSLLFVSERINTYAYKLLHYSPNSKREFKQKDYEKVLHTMISLQEELDWHCYELYDLLDEDFNYSQDLPELSVGQRAFEILMARKIKAGQLATTWFERHNSTPITELPNHWPDDYKQLVERRIQLIETNKNIRLIEQPEYKRRWNTEPWDSQLNRALKTRLLTHLESYFDFDGRMNDEGTSTANNDLTTPTLISTATLADLTRKSDPFHQVGQLYRDDPAFNIQTLVDELIDKETVPLLPILRYKPSGLRKRADWEHTWNLQRQEDAGETVGTIPVPPKYATKDFAKPHYWKLRGKLDVPKERWVSFPHCEGPDGFPVIAWAGYDPLQLATAIANYYVRVQEDFGGSQDPRLTPLLACLLEIIPWVKQWHNQPNPDFNGLRMGDYYESFATDEAQQLGKTLDDIRNWQPPEKKKGKRKKKTKKSE